VGSQVGRPRGQEHQQADEPADRHRHEEVDRRVGAGHDPEGAVEDDEPPQDPAPSAAQVGPQDRGAGRGGRDPRGVDGEGQLDAGELDRVGLALVDDGAERLGQAPGGQLGQDAGCGHEPEDPEPPLREQGDEQADREDDGEEAEEDVEEPGDPVG
jgi:hypothetical protein